MKTSQFVKLSFYLLLILGVSCVPIKNENIDNQNNQVGVRVKESRKPKYLADPTNKLEKKIQELELEYVVWGCACANWITPKDRIKYDNSGLSKHSIFIEPADSTIEFPDSTFQAFEENIIVIGQFYEREDYPKGTFEMEESLEKGKVFRFTKLKVVKKQKKTDG